MFNSSVIKKEEYYQQQQEEDNEKYIDAQNDKFDYEENEKPYEDDIEKFTHKNIMLEGMML